MKKQNTRFAVRVYSRFPVQVTLLYRGPNSAGQGIVQELSRVGCRVVGNDPVVEGETLSIGLSHHISQPPMFIERATVKWVKGLEFGLAFTQLQPRQADQLQRLIEALLQTGSSSDRSSRTLKGKPPAA